MFGKIAALTTSPHAIRLHAKGGQLAQVTGGEKSPSRQGVVQGQIGSRLIGERRGCQFMIKFGPGSGASARQYAVIDMPVIAAALRQPGLQPGCKRGLKKG